MTNLREIHRKTIKVYEEHAEAWNEQRQGKFFEKEWIDRFIHGLPPSGQVLEVGCGTGEPISRYLIQQRFKLTGIDASPKMIEIASSRLSDGDWIVMDMRSLSLPLRYDGVISWDGFFHLTPEEQRPTLALFCQHLNPGGSMLLTIGDKAGEVLGTVHGAQVYHSSLDPREYEEILKAAGFLRVTIALRDKSCGGHSVLHASDYLR